MATPPPIVLALLTCEHLHRDPGTDAWTLLGVHDVFPTARRTGRRDHLSFFLESTEVSRRHVLGARLLSAEDRRPLGRRMRIPVSARDPLSRVRTGYNATALELEPGTYVIQILLAEEVLHEVRFEIVAGGGL